MLSGCTEVERNLIYFSDDFGAKNNRPFCIMISNAQRLSCSCSCSCSSRDWPKRTEATWLPPEFPYYVPDSIQNNAPKAGFTENFGSTS